jgi:hypothetical protein
LRSKAFVCNIIDRPASYLASSGLEVKILRVKVKDSQTRRPVARMSYLVKNFPIFAIVTLPRIAYNGYVRREDETMNVTVRSFFEVGDHYEYVKDNEITVLSVEMMGCMVTQYEICGYMVDHFDGIICVSIVNNAIENFSKKIAKKG